MKKAFVFILFVVSIQLIAAESETKKTDTVEYIISPDDQVLIMIDSMLSNKYYNAFGFCVDSSIAVLDSNYTLNDSLLKQRLEALDNRTPFDLRYNEYTKAFINLYVNKKRKLSSSVLGLAPLYFPMIEEVLDKYNMPLELKYLAVVESALNPSARSRVGAQGLWQFMYRTGKMYNLNVTSYCDDRMNPYKATVAACEYMKDLYGMYGDWSLVLAAYNSGPGNVNKAIRRSGGHKDYWKIRAWLPSETRGYVPAFIAVNYMMSYAKEYGLYPENNQLFSTLVDTVEIHQSISFDQLTSYLNVSKEELLFFNPMYKLGYIPVIDEAKTLCLPLDQVGLYLINEKAIFADINRIKNSNILVEEKQNVLPPEMLTHYVRSGEFLGYIAKKYNCSVNDLMTWNNLRSTRLNPGDRLNIYAKGSSIAKVVSNEKTVSKPDANSAKPLPKGKYQIHIVRSGDTLWDIAKKYNDISVNDLKRLNNNLNYKRLKPGMQVKVKEIG